MNGRRVHIIHYRCPNCKALEEFSPGTHTDGPRCRRCGLMITRAQANASCGEPCPRCHRKVVNFVDGLCGNCAVEQEYRHRKASGTLTYEDRLEFMASRGKSFSRLRRSMSL